MKRSKGMSPHDDPPARRPKASPGRIPTIGELLGETSWVWAYCAAGDCHHRAPLRLAEAVARFGADASSDVLRQRARCQACGRLGATLRHPSWVNSLVGTAPFPGEAAR